MKNLKDLQRNKKSARRYSIQEGIFASVKSALGDNYLSPFAVAINMSNSLVALMSSVSGILGPLSQVFSSRLIEKYPRKKIVREVLFFESLMFIPFILIGFLFSRNILVNSAPILFFILFSLYVMVMNIASPAWFSWMGDVVDEEYRGRWFSKRNLIVGFISFTLAILSSFFLDYFKQNGFLMWGFIILFLFAIVARLISWKIFEYQYEPKIKLKRGDYFSFFDYVLKLKDSNFGKFSIFRAALSLTSAISSPLLVVYLLRYLEFSYPIYMIITFSGTFFSLILLGLWGKIADWFGNCKIFFLTSFFIPLIPLLWILSSNVFYLIFVPSLIGGVFWAGFNLASSNFIYDNVSREKRGLAVSYFNLLNGVGIFLGAGLSALLMNYLPFEAINSIVLIFLLSFLLRVVVFVLFLPFIKEVRKMNNPFNNSAFESLVFKQVKPTLLEEAHQLMSIKKYFRR